MLSFLPTSIALSAGSDAPPSESTGQRLAALADDYWETILSAYPTAATALGHRRYDDRLEDITPAGHERVRVHLETLRAGVEALDPGELSEPEQVTRSVLAELIDTDLDQLACELYTWVVDPLSGPQVSFFNIPSYQIVRTAREAEMMVQRWRAMGPYLDAHITNLEMGIASGRVAVSDPVRRVLDQLAASLARPSGEWALLKPLAREHPELSPAERDGFARDLREAVERIVRPAFERYRNFLEREVLPRARPEDRAGIGHLPDGDPCYRRLIRAYTSLDLAPETIHQVGLDEVARIRDEMSRVGIQALGTGDFPSILERLRTDKALYFTTRDEVEEKAREAVARAQAKTPEWFGILPRTPCEVVRMEAHEEKHSTAAYYRQPAADGSRPGRYTINTYAPETRTRFGAESLAFHEAVPGHHFQIAIAQEASGLPEFRRHAGITAYIEGWALYAETLADEMGLYSGDLERLGKLSEENWRACRLVVDTGIHALGWSRQRAIETMRENIAEAGEHLTNEVDRYITWPGQALAYKLGMLEIQKLRAEGEKRLGDRFDIRAFHDCVLRHGAVGLGTLRELVHKHYAAVESGR